MCVSVWERKGTIECENERNCEGTNFLSFNDNQLSDSDRFFSVVWALDWTGKKIEETGIQLCEQIEFTQILFGLI